MKATVDDLLSLSAKGLLAMLKTKWPVEPVEIVDIPLSAMDSLEDIEAAITELEVFGYIQWDREKDTVQLREDPDAAGHPITGYEGTKEWVI
ncbi:MAG: response regulator [Bacilli bacterium]